MVNRDQIESFMKNFPSQALILTMEPEDLGAHMLKYMMCGQAETNRFNFMQMVYPGQTAERFMEAWGWLEREGFIAHRPNDINGHGFFVTRAGQRVAQSANFNAWKSESMFPDGLDPIIMSSVEPMFVRGEYDTAVFRAFKEVEVRLRNKDPSLACESGVDLMNRAFGPTAADWAAQQIVECCAWDRAPPRFLIHDPDSRYGVNFDRHVRGLGIRQVRTPFRSPEPMPSLRDG